MLDVLHLRHQYMNVFSQSVQTSVPSDLKPAGEVLINVDVHDLV